MNHPIKSGCKKISSSVDMVETVISENLKTLALKFLPHMDNWPSVHPSSPLTLTITDSHFHSSQKPHLNSVHEKANNIAFSQIRKIVNYFPRICVKVKISGIFMTA